MIKKKPSRLLYIRTDVDHAMAARQNARQGAISYVGDNGGSVTECGCSCKNN